MYSPNDLVLSPRGVRFHGRYFPCSMGRGGLTATKQEGDGATPVGHHQIVGMFYRPDRLMPPNDWATPIGPTDLWSDAPDQPDYNTQVRAPYPHSHECLRRSDPLYDLVLVTDYNWPNAVENAGSAIFIHQWRRPHYPTEGCIALSRRDLWYVATHMSKDTRLIIPAHMPVGQR